MITNSPNGRNATASITKHARERYLVSTGIAGTAYFGADAEFYIVDSVAFDFVITGPARKPANIPQALTSLSAVIDRLEADHEYLTAGGVFTPDLIETWITYKRENEIDPINVRPHPYEFALYYDV